MRFYKDMRPADIVRALHAEIRKALASPEVGTFLTNEGAEADAETMTPQQFGDALAAAEKGPLPQAALDRLSALRQAFSGEPR